jgi:adenosylmethionine-8-amino-7-oxononanoate aminotransferase
MVEETAEKLDAGEGDAPQLVSAVVAIAEGYVAVVEGLETTIADGDAEQIAAQVIEHLLAAAGRLSVHHPGYLPDGRRRILE